MTEPQKPRSSVPAPGSTATGNPSRAEDAISAETVQSSDTNRDGAGSNAPNRFAVLPTRFGRYEIQKELGRGQMGAVYLAQDLELDRPVALKVARASASNSTKLLQRMQVEAKAAAKIDHPLICKVYDTGEIEDIRYIALQYVEGVDLKKFMKSSGRRIEPATAIRFVSQILGALNAAHEKGIIHRDLKPENVMVNKNQEPVIMDFGLARNRVASTDAGLTQGMIVGTAAYMPPEQATGRADAIDHRCDLYAAGVILFEMLTGEWPFTGAAIEVMGKKCVQEPPSPLAIVSTLDPQLAAVCLKMIAKRKEDRFNNCADALTALTAIGVDARRTPPKDKDLIGDKPQIVSLPAPAVAPVRLRPIAKAEATNKPVSRPTPVNKPKPVSKNVARKSTANLNFWLLLAAVGITSLCVLISVIFILQRPSNRTALADPQHVASNDKKTEQPFSDQKLSIDDFSPPVESRALPSPLSEFPENAPDDSQERTIADNSIEPKAIDPLVTEENSNAEQFADMRFEKSGENPPSQSLDPKNESVDLGSTRSDVIRVIEKAESLLKNAEGKDAAAKLKEAVLTLKKGSNLYSKEIHCDFYLGILHSGIGINDPKTAEFHFKRALDRSPNHVPTMNNLALVSIKSRKFAQVRNFLGLLGNESPRPFEVNQNIGRVLNQSKLLDIKPDELKRITSFNTEPAVYRADKGWIYLPLDASERAISDIKCFCRNGALEDPSCSTCNGFGSLPCKACGSNGGVLITGTITGSINSPIGSFATSTPSTAAVRCNVCNGRGRVDCRNCEDGRDPSLSRR